MAAPDADTLEMQLGSGSTILLSTALYWNNGPRIGLDEVIALLGEPGK